MAKHFVYAGLQFDTIELERRVFAGFTDITTVEAVTLDSVVTALGTGVVADLAALIALWNESPTPPITDTFQRLARGQLNLANPLVSGTQTDREDGTTTGRVFQRSYQYILPPGLSNGMSVLSTSSGNADRERNRLLVKSLEVRHDNIRKYGDAGPAWDAWVEYVIASEAEQELTTAARGYFVTPPSRSE